MFDSETSKIHLSLLQTESKLFLQTVLLVPISLLQKFKKIKMDRRYRVGLLNILTWPHKHTDTDTDTQAHARTLCVHRQACISLASESNLRNLTGEKTPISSAFAANRHQILPDGARFPVLPQSGNVCAMLGLVVAFCEQLREPEGSNWMNNWMNRKQSTIEGFFH